MSSRGLVDLAENRVTDPALLVLSLRPDSSAWELRLPDRPSPRLHEHHLYDRLAQRLGNDAHSQYNCLIRRIVSYSRALEREKTAQGKDV